MIQYSKNQKIKRPTLQQEYIYISKILRLTNDKESDRYQKIRDSIR
jgi:hypothetical protein